MSSAPSPDLFIREDGQPMAFLMGPTGYERQEVKALVEAGGGVLLSQPTLVYREFMIRLLVRTEIPIKKDQDMYNYKYVLDCVEKNEILPNLNDYKVTSHVPSIFEPYNALDILQGILKWSDVPRKQLGERVSDIEDEDGESSRLYEAEYRHYKAQKLPYCKKEQLEIVEWIVKYSAYKLLRGNMVWQRMEEVGVGRGRSWQSLKEHFRKAVINQIHTYGLTRRVIDQFYVGMGIHEEVLDSGTEFETREDVEARIKLAGRSLTRKTTTRSRSPSSTPPNKILNKRITKGKRSKVPADKEDSTAGSSIESAEKEEIPPPPLDRRSTEDQKEDQENAPVEKKCHSQSHSTEHNPKLIDVGQDPELEQLLDQSVVPLHLGDKFPSSGSEDDSRVIRDKITQKKRKLFSGTFLDSAAEESDMFAVSPIKKSKGRPNLEITQEMPSSEEFREGLKDIASLSDSQDIEGCVTSTQKGLRLSAKDDAQVPVIDDVFESAELNLVISESSGSATKERDNPPPQSTVTASIHHSPSGSNPYLSNHEGSRSPNSSHQSESQNLLAPEPGVDVNTYTLSQAVTNLEDIPVVEAENDNVDGGEVIEEPVDTQGLANAITSIGDHDPGLEPGPSKQISSISRSSRSGANNFPSNNFQVLGIRPHPPRPTQSSPKTTPLPSLRKGKRRVSKMSVAQDKIENEKEDESNYDIFEFSDGEHNDNSLERRASPTDTQKTGGCSKVPRSGPYWAPDKTRGEGKGKVQKGIKIPKGVEAHVGFSKGGELHMVLGNLPCDPEDIDSEDIELVRTGRKGHKKVRNFSPDSDESVDIVDVSKSDENDVVRRVNKDVDVLSPEPGPSRRNDEKIDISRKKGKKLKLKLITLEKENSKGNERKRGRFVREGEFDDKFRLPYSKREEEAIVKYLLEEGGYKLRRGNRIWERMEDKGICPGRTWQSMKQRWEKYISKSLEKFKVTEEDLKQRDAQDGSDADEDDLEESSDTSSQRGYRSNANYYTKTEDLKILEFMVSNHRFDVGGRSMWQLMVARGVLPGRSWHSLKERFRKVVIKNIRNYGLSEETVQKLLSRCRERLNTV